MYIIRSKIVIIHLLCDHRLLKQIQQLLQLTLQMLLLTIFCVYRNQKDYSYSLFINQVRFVVKCNMGKYDKMIVIILLKLIWDHAACILMLKAYQCKPVASHYMLGIVACLLNNMGTVTIISAASIQPCTYIVIHSQLDTYGMSNLSPLQQSTENCS